MESETIRHFHILEFDKHERIASEAILLAIEDPDESIPATIVTEAVFQAHTLDYIIPLLIQRSRSEKYPLEKAIESETLKATRDLEQMLTYMKAHKLFLQRL